MSDAVTMKITGLEELEQALNSLGPKLAKKVADRGLREAGKEFVEAFKDAAPKESGFLSEHFAAKLSHHGEGALAATVRVGPTTDKYPRTKSGLPASVVAELLEFGRRPKGQGRKTTRYRHFGDVGGAGKVAMHPFMTATYEALKGSAAERIEQAIRDALAEVVQGAASTAIAKSLSSLL